MSSRTPRLISESLTESPADSARPDDLRRRVFFRRRFRPARRQGLLSEASARPRRAFADVGPLEQARAARRLGLALGAWRCARRRSRSCTGTTSSIATGAQRAGFGAQIAAVRALCGLSALRAAGARARRRARRALGAAGHGPRAARVRRRGAGVHAARRGCSAPGLDRMAAGWRCRRLASRCSPATAHGARLNLEWLAKGFACIVETAQGEKPNWDERCAAFADAHRRGRPRRGDRRDRRDRPQPRRDSGDAALAPICDLGHAPQRPHRARDAGQHHSVLYLDRAGRRGDARQAGRSPPRRSSNGST